MLRAIRWQDKIGKTYAITALFRRLLRPLAAAAVMFLLMHAEIIPDFAPFAAAFLAAGLAAGENPAALVLGCLAGMLRFPLRDASMISAVGCAGVLAGELLFSILPGLKNTLGETRASLTAGFGLLLPALAFARGEMLASLQSLGCAALAAACAPFLLPAMNLRLNRRRIGMQEKIGAAVLACACLMGLHALYPPLAQASALMLALLLPETGAGGGVLWGAALAGGGLHMIAVFGVCGFVSGLRIYTKNWQRSLAVSAAWCLMALLSQQGGFAVGIIATVLAVLIPDAFRSRLKIFTHEPALDVDPERISLEAMNRSGRRLRALGDAFGEMAEGCISPTDVPDEQALISSMRERLCTGCSGYGECWNGDDNSAVRFLCHLIEASIARCDAPPGERVLYADGDVPPDVLRFCRRGRMIPDRLGLLLRDFTEKRRSEIKRCTTGQLLSVQLAQAREILYDLAESQSRPLCGRKTQALQAALDAALDDEIRVTAFGGETTEIHLRKEGGWSRIEAQRAGEAVRRTWNLSFAAELNGNLLCFRQRPRFWAETGAACQSGVAGQPCGDSHLMKMLAGNRLAVMLADGMGSGEGAERESSETLRLLHCFLDAGISRPLALETLNQQMLMRSGEETFATVDLCLIDLNTGVTEMTKLAACRTLVIRDGELLRIEGGRLPLGILERVQPDVKRLRVRSGDTIVMGSDGVMELGDGMMIDRIARLSAALPPQQLAEKLVREAAIRRARGRSDDMTCICIKIGDARERKSPFLAKNA